MKDYRQLIETLRDSEVFKNYERAFNETTDLPLTLRPLETWQLPLHRRRNENPFCAMLAGNSRACAACLRTQEELAQSAAEKPAAMTCTYGLCETAAPVKLGNRTIGLLQTGQVLCSKPSQRSYTEAVERANEIGVDIKNPEAKKKYFRTPVLSRKKLEAATDLLANFAEYLSFTSNQIAVQSENEEPPIITRAKQFIEENYTEELSLNQVAKVVNTSQFYFCKLFRKSVGVTFTEYVSRVRIEKAKNFLLNPNLRISEIAYEVGFQSLTHFNRTFKKVVGESPTDYRNRLPRTHGRRLAA